MGYIEKLKTKMGYIEKLNGVNVTLLSLLFFAVVLFGCFSTTTTICRVLSPVQNSEYLSPETNNIDVPKDDLETVLEEASMGGNKTIIIAVLNKAYVEGDNLGRMTMLDLFLEAFWVGEDTVPLLNHLLIVAVDQTAYDRCKFRRLHCYKLVTDGVDFSKENFFMSELYVKMMWTRVLFLGNILKRGYSFIFTDTDIMWLRNPFKRLSLDESVDFQPSCDIFNGNPWSLNNTLNAGFYYVRSNNKTIALFDSWYSNKNIASNEQFVLEKLKKMGVFEQLGLKVRFMENLYFSGFCIDSRDFNVVTTVHANCCRGVKAKVIDMIVAMEDWSKYKNSNDRTMRFHWSNHSACKDSWKF